MSTEWRTIGDTTLAAFRAALKGTPLEPEADAIYEITRPHTKLLIAQAKVESRLARDPLPADHNFLGQRPRGGDGFKDFGSYAECARYWYGKITDLGYAYAETVTLEQYIHVYAPSSDGNNEAEYVASVLATVNGLPSRAADPTPVPTPGTRGKVAKPPVVRSWVTNKQIGVGRDPDQQRVGRIVGTCHHTMDGFLLGTDDWFHRLDIASLTDYGIGGAPDGPNDGVIYEWIDPQSEVVPWANGTVGDATAPYGDAPAFLQEFGISAVNSRLRSIETSDGARPDADKSKREIESLCHLTAWIHSEQAGQTAETFEWNMHHREFGVDHQGCPGAYIVEHVDEIQARIRAIIHAYQTNTPLEVPILITYPLGWNGGTIRQPGEGTTVPVPTTPPPTTEPSPLALPSGMSLGVAQRLFNPLAIVQPSGQVIDFGLDVGIARSWLRHYLKTVPKGKAWSQGDWPPLTGITRRGDGRVVYQFGDGWVYEQAA